MIIFKQKKKELPSVLRNKFINLGGQTFPCAKQKMTTKYLNKTLNFSIINPAKTGLGVKLRHSLS